MPCSWIITKDYIGNGEANGTIGPSSATGSDVEKLRAGGGQAFRMKDDDGELYYRGRFIGAEGTEAAFSPFDDFGTPNAGCTIIQYRRWSDGKWETL